jgi:lipid-binding SYLF domain-containing protein
MRAIAWALLGLLIGTTVVHADAERIERVDRAREVFQELIQAPDRAVPESLLVRAKAIAIFPRVLKAALGFGGRYGKGVVSCRDSAGHWSPPAFLTLTGGSWGLQIGAESAEVVLIFMTERGTRSLLDSKFTLGAKAGLAAGPVGRTAEMATDLKLDAEIYSYARSKGLFAGISLEGARLAPDDRSIRSFYGEPVSAQALLFDHKAPRVPPAAEKLIQALP